MTRACGSFRLVFGVGGGGLRPTEVAGRVVNVGKGKEDEIGWVIARSE